MICFDSSVRFIRINNSKDFNYSLPEYLDAFQIEYSLLNDLEELALQKEIAFSHLDFRQNSQYFKSRLKADIARVFWGSDKYYQVLLLYDNQYSEARKLFLRMESMLHPSAAEELVNY